jgi:drug/metabolite transporter (DMT)-like permease
MPKFINKQLVGYFFIIFTGVMFGSLEVASKLIPHINPLQLNFVRFLIGGIVVLPFAIMEVRAKKIRVRAGDIAYNAALGVLFVGFSMTLMQIGISKVPACQVAFIFSANPMIIATLATFILKEKPNIRTFVFIILGMIGIIFIVEPFSGRFNFDVIYPVVAVTLFGTYIVLARKLSRRLGSIFVTAVSILFGTTALGIYNAATGVGLITNIKPADLSIVLFIGVFISGFAYVAYFKGMEFTTTNTGSITFFLKALTATILSIMILKYNPSTSVYIGGCFIFAGTIVLILSNVSAANRVKKRQ